MSQRKRRRSASSNKLLAGQSSNRTRSRMAPTAASSANDDDEEEGCREQRQQRAELTSWKRTLQDEDEEAKIGRRSPKMAQRKRTITSRSHQQQVWGIFARSVPRRRKHQADRSQPLAASLVFIFLLLISSYLGGVASAVQFAHPNGSQHSPTTSANLERLQVNLVPAPRAANATTTRRMPTSTIKFEEQEVDLLRPTRPPAQANSSNRKPRIYKVRADNLNGRLSLPLRLNINDRLLSIPVDRRLAAVPLEFQVNRTLASASTTRLPAISTTPETATTSSTHSTARGEQQFGARGPPSKQAAPNRTADDCKPDADGRDQGSISMSSQTLRLVPTLAGASGLVGRATPVGGRENGSAGDKAARLTASEGNWPQQQRGRHRAVAAASVAAFNASNSPIEVEETESAATSARHANQQGDQLESASSHASSRSPSGRPVGAKRQDEANFHQVVSGIRVAGDELSFVGPPATSGAELGASVESLPASPGSPDSILSLIDEYDSKIITNRTKAQLSCDSGEMILRLNFSEPYKGIVYPDHDRLSPCRFFGDGHLNYELRLPLRGCGTRQAAPRVFVNDVIVRFHKTLELEEDEVKTLICRYPPPLASSTPLEQGGAVSFAGNRPTATSGSTPGGGGSGNKLEQESPSPPFEFIEPTGGRSTRPEPGSSGNIETLSENLIVAPASGIKLSGSPIGNSAFMTPPYAGGRAPGANQERNSIVAEPPSGAGNNNNSASRSNLFERLSSVELLMLISSLMFLILLLIGLASSYLCFRRRARRTQHGQRASSILKSGTQRRYLGPGAISQIVTTSAASAGRRSTQPPSSFSHGSHQRAHYQVAPGQLAQHYKRGQQQQASITAPSSPDSDLSARGLLASDLANQQQQQMYQAQQPTSSYVYRNAAYVPDQPQAGYNLLPRAAGVGGGVYSAVPFAVLAPSAGRKQKQPQQPAGLVKPVLGRRDTVYGYSAFGQPPVGRAGFNGQQLNGAQYAMVGKQSKQIVAPEMWRAKSLSSVQDQQQQVLQPGEHQISTNWKLPSAQLIDATLGRRELAAREEQARRRHSQRHRYYAGDRSQATEESAEEQDEQDERGWREATPARQQQVSGIRIPPLKFTGSQKPAQTKILLKSIEDSYITNYTEIEEQEYIKSNSTRRISMDQWRALQPKSGSGNQPGGQWRPPASGGPSTGSNERNHSDPHQRLVRSARLIGSGSSSNSDSEASDLGNSNSFEAASSMAGDQQRSTNTNQHHHNQANLRSLTELDVNFAKSLLMPVSQFNSKFSSSQQQKSPSASGALSDGEQINRNNHGGEGADNVGSPGARRRRSRSVTELAPARTTPNTHQLQASTRKEDRNKTRDGREGDATSGTRRAPRRQLQSPDLILSPEYDLDRLALESPLSSHNSVSYV